MSAPPPLAPPQSPPSSKSPPTPASSVSSYGSSDAMYFSCDNRFMDPLMSELTAQHRSNTFTDFTIHTSDTTAIPCHRNILAANSQYFRALFHSNMKETKESQVHLDSLQPYIVKLLVDYFYSGNINISCDDVKDLIEACDFMLLEDVKDKCAIFINSILCPDNCLGWCAFATSYNMENVIQETTKVMRKMFIDVCQADEFLNLSLAQLLEYIRDKNIEVSTEDPVLNACIGWIDYDTPNRKDMLQELLENINLSFCTPCYLQHVTVKRSALFSLCRIPKIISEEDGSRTCPRVGFSARLNFGKYKLFILETLTSGVWYSDEIDSTFKSSTLGDIHGLNRFATCLISEGVLICGGMRGTGMSKECHKFISKTCEWHRLPDMASVRALHSVENIGDDIFAIGGWKGSTTDMLTTVERFDQKQLCWTHVADLIDAQQRPISVHLGVFIYVIVSGELQNGVLNRELISKHGLTVQEYNGITDKWSNMSPLPDVVTATIGAKACTLADSIYLVGGLQQLCLKYDQEADTWTRLSNTHHLHIFGAVVCNKDKIWLIGGSGEGLDTGLDDAIEEYDPETDQWTIIQWKIPTALRNHAAYILLTNKQ